MISEEAGIEGIKKKTHKFTYVEHKYRKNVLKVSQNKNNEVFCIELKPEPHLRMGGTRDLVAMLIL